MSAFEQVLKEQQGKVPSLRDVLRVIVAAGLDRGSLVREPDHPNGPGIVVAMLGSKAIQDVGPVCIEASIRIEKDAGVYLSKKPLDQVMMDGESKLQVALAWVDEKVPRWAWLKTFLSADGKANGDGNQSDVLVWMATGPGVTEQLCRELTKAGCVTKLK